MLARTITEWLLLIDIYSNFACYTLTFEHSKGHYHKLCQCLDTKCKDLWYRMVLGEHDMAKLAEDIEADHQSKASIAMTINTSESPIMHIASQSSYEPHSPQTSAAAPVSPVDD